MLTESERVEAIRQILIQIYGLLDAGLPAPHIGRIEREVIFFLYESVGLDKLAESRPHSAEARKIRCNPTDKLSRLVTYDHAIPLAMLREGLKKATASQEEMHAFLRRFVRGAIITREEDKRLNQGLRRKLPNGAASHDIMARYRAAGIIFEPTDEAMLCQDA